MEPLAIPVSIISVLSCVDVDAQPMLLERAHPLLVMLRSLINSRILSQQFSPLSCSISFVLLFLRCLLSWLISIGLFHQHTNILVLLPSSKNKNFFWFTSPFIFSCHPSDFFFQEQKSLEVPCILGMSVFSSPTLIRLSSLLLQQTALIRVTTELHVAISWIQFPGLEFMTSSSIWYSWSLLPPKNSISTLAAKTPYFPFSVALFQPPSLLLAHLPNILALECLWARSSELFFFLSSFYLLILFGFMVLNTTSTLITC